MPSSRRQSAAEPASTLAPKTPASHKANGTPAKNPNAPVHVPSADPGNLQNHKTNHTIINSSALPEPIGISSSSSLSKKSNGLAGRGFPPSKPAMSSKRHLSTSDIPPGAGTANTKATSQFKKHRLENGNSEIDNPQPSLMMDTFSHTPMLRCHQCRVHVKIENAIACTNKKSYQFLPKRRKSEPVKDIASTTTNISASPQDPQSVLIPCIRSFCGRCLLTRYGHDLKKIRPTPESAYKWSCPLCEDYCNCSPCRKKKGLQPTGRLTKIATEAGYTSARELLEVNPNAQGSEMSLLAANRREKEKSKQSPSATQLTKSKTDKLSKQTSKSNQAPASALSSKTKKLAIKPHKKNTPKKKSNLQDKKSIETVKRLKKQRQLIKKSKSKKSQIGDKQFIEPSPSNQNSTPATGNENKAKTSDKQTIAEPEGPKQPVKRPPHVVEAPAFSYLPTGILSSKQILLRLHVREFLCRFKDLIPGLGGTQAKNQHSESQRAEKIIDSMDDLLNFWVDDEGGMRAIMNGLAKLIQSDYDHLNHQSNQDSSLSKNPNNHSTSSPSSTVLKSDKSPSILTQLKRECKYSIAPSPYLQSSVACWLTATNLLEEEGFKSQMTRDTEDPFISSYSSSNDTGQNIESLVEDDDRLQRVKFSPIKKVAIISAMIDLTLRGPTLSEDLTQGLDRERQARYDILKERAKLNKKWAEIKAKKMAIMPSKKALLCAPPEDSAQGSTASQSVVHHPSETSKELIDQETARVKALVEWEVDMNQAEDEHKNEIRMSCIEQYKVESSNRLRFQLTGQDTRKNSYYILSSTPGRSYPSEIELGYSWSYSLIMHGSEPTNLREKTKQKSHNSVDKKSAEDNVQVKTNNTLDPQNNDDKGNDEQIDMLEGGQRCSSDQWIRVSDPKDIRQLASWIEYEAKLIDFYKSNETPSLNQHIALNGSSTTPKMIDSNSKQNNITINKNQSSSSSSVGNVGLTNGQSASHGNSTPESSLKSISSLVDQINRFSEFVNLKVQQRLELMKNDRRSGLKSRN